MTVDLDPEHLANLLEVELGTRVTITEKGGVLLLGLSQPVRLEIWSPAPHLFEVIAAMPLGETSPSLAMRVANRLNLGGEPLGHMTIEYVNDRLTLLIVLRVHGPIDPGREFGAAIRRTLATRAAYSAALSSERSRVANMEAIDASIREAPRRTAMPPNAPGGKSNPGPPIPGYL